MRATLDWSHALLDDEEAAFARLAVFAGGCSPDAAERVASASLDVIDRLLAKSMLTRRLERRDASGDAEPIRQYAAERLAALQDAQDVEYRHERYFVDFAETVRPSSCAATRASGSGASTPRPRTSGARSRERRRQETASRCC